MTQPRKHTARLLLAVLAALPGVPALAFDLDSDVPITVSAGNAGWTMPRAWPPTPARSS